MDFNMYKMIRSSVLGNLVFWIIGSMYFIMFDDLVEILEAYGKLNPIRSIIGITKFLPNYNASHTLLFKLRWIY